MVQGHESSRPVETWRDGAGSPRTRRRARADDRSHATRRDLRQLFERPGRELESRQTLGHPLTRITSHAATHPRHG